MERSRSSSRHSSFSVGWVRAGASSLGCLNGCSVALKLAESARARFPEPSALELPGEIRSIPPSIEFNRRRYFQVAHFKIAVSIITEALSEMEVLCT